MSGEPAARAVVLLVDDDVDVVEALRLTLRRQNFEVLTATSGRQAHDLLETRTIDVVVADDRMPGMSGSELLTLARLSFPTTVRILLTGHPTLDATSRAIGEGGAFGFLTKPCNARTLAAMIRQALSLRAQSARAEGAAPEPFA